MTTRALLPVVMTRRSWSVFLVVLIVSVMAEFFVHHRGIDPVAGSFGFSAWYALVAGAVLVGIARVAGIVLTRPDDDHDG